jgi:hypothetical protein
MPHDELAEQSAVYALEIMHLQEINADLLAALERALEVIENAGLNTILRDAREQGRAAIAKAKGG